MTHETKKKIIFGLLGGLLTAGIVVCFMFVAAEFGFIMEINFHRP